MNDVKYLARDHHEERLLEAFRRARGHARAAAKARVAAGKLLTESDGRMLTVRFTVIPGYEHLEIVTSVPDDVWVSSKRTGRK